MHNLEKDMVRNVLPIKKQDTCATTLFSTFTDMNIK